MIIIFVLAFGASIAVVVMANEIEDISRYGFFNPKPHQKGYVKVTHVTPTEPWPTPDPYMELAEAEIELFLTEGN